MERYVVSVTQGEGTAFRLLVPMLPNASVSDLAEEVKKRVSRREIWPGITGVCLHLGPHDGPIIDEADTLSDVVIDPKVETLTAVCSVKEEGPHPVVQQQNRNILNLSGGGTIKLRIITPPLARAHADVRTIPTLRASVTHRTTLREIRDMISDRLGVITSDIVRDVAECNCSFARQIEERALRNEAQFDASRNQNDNPSLKFIAVYGRNQVQIMETSAADKSSVAQTVLEELGRKLQSKEIIYIGGTLAPGPSGQYLKMPVISVCSKERHGELAREFSGGIRSVLDMHTSEAPITITTLNLDLSIEDLGLVDCAINGVLDIYVAERKISPGVGQGEPGKDGIFLDGDAWAQVIFQSKRGIAMLLSSLRVFTSLIGAKNMDYPSQDAVLHVIHLLTRFPPAVRAVHTLMNDKSPSLCERAALSQSIYEVLKDVVPMELIKSDPRRILEGTRLVLGLVLEKAKHLKLKENVQMPYISSLRVLDLRNTFTMEPMANVIQTPFGLVEEGYYEAFKEGGILYWKTGEQPLSALPLDSRTKRISLLSGGVVSQITVLNLSTLDTSGYESQGQAERLSLSRELSDLNHLSVLCARNKLSVIPPSALPSAEPPVLTLDRDGLLAVYVGRAACAAPGKDITIFRPASGGEESVDVSIITQLLIPILKQRESEGTSIFDTFGEGSLRKYREPDEIIMVCVDCSKSMSQDSEFYRGNSDEDQFDDEENYDDESGMDSGDDERGTASRAGDDSGEDVENPVMSLDDVKDFILGHESFKDMLSIIHESKVNKRTAAMNVIEILTGLVLNRLSYCRKRVGDLKKTAALRYYRREAERFEGEITNSVSLVAGLSRYEQALYDFLIYRAANSDILDEKWTWTEGDAIPKVIKKSTGVAASSFFQGQLTIPPEFLCPVSQEIMEDPVMTCDGFTLDRQNIERWFNIRNSSPLTGLALENTELRANGQIANDIKSWITGQQIVQTASTGALPSTTPSQTRVSTRSAHDFKINFISDLGSFSRRVRSSMTVNELYRLAFQGGKGRHARFELHSNNVFTPPSENLLSSTNIQNNSDVHIIVPAAAGSSSSVGDLLSGRGASQYEDLCLVKVYNAFTSMQFSFWVPKNTTVTMAFILFRYWRFQLKRSASSFIYLRKVWMDMNDVGDGNYRGQPQDHWEPLSRFLTSRFAKGTLANEDLLGTKVESANTQGNGDVEMNDAPEGNPLVLRVYIGGEPTRHEDETPGKSLSRLDVLKSMFDAFINRLLAYNFKTHLGLITFQTTPNVAQNMTHAVESFRHRVNRMRSEGHTALWDALALANDQLSEYARQFPNAKKRIICFSDGEDTKSKQRSCDVSKNLAGNNVVVDCFCIGEEKNIELQTISYLSGGYIFKPNSLEQAMAICEMEPVLSQLERPNIQIPSQSFSHPYDPYLRFVFAQECGKVIPELVTNDTFPKRREHNRVNDSFVPLASQGSGPSDGLSRAPVSVTAHSDSNLRPARIRAEIQNIVANPHPFYDVYMSNSDMSFWKVVMQGPPESAYSTGTFVLYLDMEEGYPALPPKARFITPIHHPNINRHGKVCHSILDRNWTSDTSNLQLLNTVYSLLLVPEFSDPINAIVTLNFHWDEVDFRDEVREHIKKHAKKNRVEWKAELVTDN